MTMDRNISRRRFLQLAGLVTGGAGFARPHEARGIDLVIPRPPGRDIFLFATHVAGTSYVEEIEELEPFLQIDQRLDLFREPDNPYDERAIVVRNGDGVKLGYVPRAHNVIFSRLMDAGKVLTARISSKEEYGNWLRIGIRVYLQE